MISYLRSIYQRYFHDPQASLLFILLFGGLIVILLAGKILAAALAALIIAYLMDNTVTKLQGMSVGRGMSMGRGTATALVFVVFLAVLVFSVIGLLPLLSLQLAKLSGELPSMLNRVQDWLRNLPNEYPLLLSAEQVQALVQSAREGIVEAGQKLIGTALSSISVVLTGLIYLILVPIMVLFLLKDKEALCAWIARRLPADRRLLNTVWVQMNEQIGNYVRGKAKEVVIVGTASFLLFEVMDLAYSALLAVFVGLSTIVPYVGAVVVTIPVVAVALFQWGLDPHSVWLIVLYFVIQLLDGYVLVPLLFSQAVSLHPVVVIVAILFFGGIWGFWGVFFAIPLATLIKVTIEAWPTASSAPGESSTA